MNSITIGKRLILLRGNVPQKDVAAAVGISVTALSMYETGNRIPRDEIKIKLAQHYGRTVEEIFFAK